MINRTIKGMCLFAIWVFIFPNHSHATDRNTLINQTLDCLSQNNAANTISWNNICYTPPKTNPVPTMSMQRQAIIDEQMNVFSNPNNQVVIIHTPSQDNDSYDEDNSDDEENDSLENKEDREWYDLENATHRPKNSTVPNKAHEFSLSKEIYLSKYDEPGLMEQDGVMHGYTGAYTYRPLEGDFLKFAFLDMYRLSGEWASGDMDYTSNGTGNMEGKDNVSYNFGGVIGKDFFPNDIVRTTPYVGFHYRYLLDKSSGRQTTTGHWGYDRESNYYYFPIGLDVLFQPSSLYGIQFNGEFDWLARGKQISHISDVPGYPNDLTNTQERGFGLRGSVKLIRNFKWASLFAEGFYRFWRIGDSKIGYDASVGYYVEPLNTTSEFGLRLGVNL